MFVLGLAAAAGAPLRCVSPWPTELVPIQPIQTSYKNESPRPPHSSRDPPYSKYCLAISVDSQIRPQIIDHELPSVVILVSRGIWLERQSILYCLARSLFHRMKEEVKSRYSPLLVCTNREPVGYEAWERLPGNDSATACNTMH